MALRQPLGFLPLLSLVLLAAPGSLRAEPCPPLRDGTPLALAPLLQPAGESPGNPPDDYRHRLQTTPHGWPLQSHWCVWVEPLESETLTSGVSHRWQEAIRRALQEWRRMLPIEQVLEPERAQVRVWRRLPPLRRDAMGRARASHGRATLRLVVQGNGPGQHVEPRVEVLISPGQRLEAIQATALHELGHAFGIWGHSDNPADAMANAPGPQPILRLSGRDQATVRWLYRQATPLRSAPSGP